MPAGPVAGREYVERFIARFISSGSETEWELVDLVSAGHVVVAERIDRTKAHDKQVDQPCAGVFERDQEKIKVWRDHFDRAT